MKVRNAILLLLLSAFAVSNLDAQELSWRKHRKLAQSLEQEGELFEAAENYRMAWEKKQKKTELIYQAGELYYSLRDYRAAANAYQHVDAKQSEDQLLLLKYARSLKQDGQYDKAKTVFQELNDSYSGPDRAILQDIVRGELRGIDLTKNLSTTMDRRMEISHPGVNVNSDSEEFAPWPIGEDAVYFTSTTGGQARIYESRRNGDTWTKAAIPATFPVVQGGQYGNGSMSPDEQRFYFTICNNDGGWQGFNTRCEVYVTKRSANGWTAPEKLPDFINVKGVNSTHPSVVHSNGQEVLYFASNREGGRGGLDLWYVTRDLGTDNMDYTFPVNLGPVVNTLGDEITPFYNVDEGMLYFASNGHPSIGGLDIFKSQGGEVTWTTPANAGLPLNSGADDYGYVRNSSGYGGFFASNRVFGGEKTNTRHEDVFAYSIGGRQITLKANVYAQESGDLLENVSVALYQLFDDGSENLLITKNFASGSYLFELLPKRRFRVEITRDGYETGGYVFATDDPATYTYGQPLFLQAEGGMAGDGTVTPPNTGGLMTETGGSTTPADDFPAGTPPAGNTMNPSNGVALDAAGTEYMAQGSSAKDNLQYSSTAPRYNGTYFRIQVAALRTYNNARFANLASFGQTSTETITSSGLTRVLVGDYFSEGDAQNQLYTVQQSYPGAYIVRYDDGVRYGRVNL